MMRKNPIKRERFGSRGFRKNRSRAFLLIDGLRMRSRIHAQNEQLAVMSMAMESAESVIVQLAEGFGDNGQADAALQNIREARTYSGTQAVLDRVRREAILEVSNG